MRRETKQREAILRYLKKATSHPTADAIYEGVKKEIPKISKGTVYRNLKILQESGQIAELHIEGNTSRYEGRKENHYHFRCESCDKIYDVDEPVDTSLDERLSRKTGFLVSGHQLEFCGLCKDCQNK